MTNEELFDLFCKGTKCIICTFPFAEIELRDVVETPEGYCHRDCLDEQAPEEPNLEDEDNECGKAHNNGEETCMECEIIKRGI